MGWEWPGPGEAEGTGLWMPFSGVPLQQGGACAAGGKARALPVGRRCVLRGTAVMLQCGSCSVAPVTVGLIVTLRTVSPLVPSVRGISQSGTLQWGAISPGGLLDPGLETESPALASVTDRKDLTPER